MSKELDIEMLTRPGGMVPVNIETTAALVRRVLEQETELKRLRGERDKPLKAGRDQLEGFLQFYASEPYADSNNETVRVKAVLLTTAADELKALRNTLRKLMQRYVSLVESGDCGAWDPWKEDEVVAACAALNIGNDRDTTP